MAEGVRIDKWLWAARFFKTRSLAQTQIERNHIKIGDENIKPSRLVKVGETVAIDTTDVTKTVVVRGLSDVRGAAPVAQLLYEETAESLKAREEASARRKLFTEPAALVKGRPTKRDRRDLSRFTESD
jgi:ribosome-associated heat shock protein Hsp15